MYTPIAYAESDTALLHARMREWSFATLVTIGPNGVNATHLPFLVDAGNAGNGVLTAHLARANPQYQDLLADGEAMVIFQGPHAFISPSWYANQLTFPTWNYTAIHARGTPVLIEEADGIYAVLQKTVAVYDTPVGGSWDLAAMPDTLTLSRLQAIVAFQIPIRSLEGKMKLNQDKSLQDRIGVVEALERKGAPQDLAIARLMREFDHPVGQI